MKRFLYRFFFSFFSPKNTLYFLKIPIPGGTCLQHQPPLCLQPLLRLLGPSPRPGSSGGPAAAVAGWTRWERQGASHPLPTLPPTNYSLPWGDPLPGTLDRGRDGQREPAAVPTAPPPPPRGCWAWICGGHTVTVFLSCSMSLLNLIKCSAALVSWMASAGWVVEVGVLI